MILTDPESMAEDAQPANAAVKEATDCTSPGATVGTEVSLASAGLEHRRRLCVLVFSGDERLPTVCHHERLRHVILDAT